MGTWGVTGPTGGDRKRERERQAESRMRCYFLNLAPRTKERPVWYSSIRQWQTGGGACENLFTMIMNKLSYIGLCLPLTVIVIKERDRGKGRVCVHMCMSVCVCACLPDCLRSRAVAVIRKTSLLAGSSCHVTASHLNAVIPDWYIQRCYLCVCVFACLCACLNSTPD